MFAAQPAGSSARFNLLFASAAVALVLTLAAAFVLPAPWSWSIGLVYIAWDTWLLSSMLRSSRAALRELRPPLPGAPAATVRLAILVAARNERHVLPGALDRLLAQIVPGDRIVVVDDGSTDATGELLASRYAVAFAGERGESAHHPLSVLSRPNQGKARALNGALPLVREEVVVTLDADTFVEPGALEALRAAFAAEPALTAACGVLAPVCLPAWSSRAFELYQTFEYLRGFLWRLAWTRDDTLVLVSGAFAAFRRPALIDAGGFDPSCLVEDYELMFRLHRRSLQAGAPLKARVLGGARATTDVPARPATFLRQRTRWFAGFIQTLLRNRDMVGRREFGLLGTRHLVVKTVDLLLPIYGLCAVLALVGLLVSGKGLSTPILFLLGAKLVFDLSCHFRALLLYQRWLGLPARGQRARALFATLTEPLGFQIVRQLGALLGWIAFLRGRIEWHPQHRSLLASPTDAPGRRP